jgi:hypothetical protein
VLRKVDRIGATIFTGLILVSAFCLHAFWMIPNHDNAIYIVEAQRLVGGGKFYSDILEVTPPLIVLLTVPSIAFASFTGIDPYAAFSAWMCVLILLSLCLTRSSLVWIFEGRPAARAWAMAAYPAVLAFIPGYDFGQRDHLVIVLSAPFLLWFATREAGRPSAIGLHSLTTSAFATVGVLIKPFFLLVPMMLFLTRARTQRTWRTLYDLHLIVFAVITLSYIFVIVVAFPEYLAVASLVREVYFGFEGSLRTYSAAFFLCPLPLCTAAAVAKLAPATARLRKVVLYLVFSATLFFLLAVAQRKGWFYHLQPALQLNALAIVLLVPSLGPLARSWRMSRFAAAVIGLALLGSGGFLVARMLRDPLHWARSRYMTRPFVRAAVELGGGRRWVAFSTSISPVFPTVLLSHGEWASRAPSQWLVPGIVKLGRSGIDQTRAKELKAIATRFVVEDLDRYRPDMVAVQMTDHMFIEGPFDFISFFDESEEFRRRWASYTLAKTVDGWNFYTRVRPD